MNRVFAGRKGGHFEQGNLDKLIKYRNIEENHMLGEMKHSFIYIIQLYFHVTFVPFSLCKV